MRSIGSGGLIEVMCMAEAHDYIAGRVIVFAVHFL
jgi:hypothetical protein